MGDNKVNRIMGTNRPNIIFCCGYWRCWLCPLYGYFLPAYFLIGNSSCAEEDISEKTAKIGVYRVYDIGYDTRKCGRLQRNT